MTVSVNYIQIIFSLLTTVIIIVGSLINSFERYLPAIFVEIFRYGKFSYKGKSSFIKPIQVPKSWFRHFYISASVLQSFTFYVVTCSYIFNSAPPKWLIDILDTACGTSRVVTTKSTHVFMAIFLLWLQCLRRFYDTNFVSVYGRYSKMDLGHYLIGLFHYFGAIIAILSEAPSFAHDFYEMNIKFAKLSYLDIAAVTLFLWAWWHQYVATTILANLRKNAKGEKVTDEHKLPEGDWFSYVSSPHLLAEILMYFSLTILLWGNTTWKFVFAWVLCNQVETALLSHWWYRETFTNYPKQRRAIIPFVY